MVAMRGCMKLQARMGLVLLVTATVAAILKTPTIILPAQASPEEGRYLKAFMAEVDESHELEKSWVGDDPCFNWHGVTCTNGLVFRLVLENLQLRGEIPAGSLSNLANLRVISLQKTNLSGPLPDLTNSARTLFAIWIQDNEFSGEIHDIFSMTPRLKKLFLARNKLSGRIPESLALNATHLMALHLESNQLSGPLWPFNQPSLTDFDVSDNQLSGPIPQTPVLMKFSGAAFQNTGLCGQPSSSLCPSSPPFQPHFQPQTQPQSQPSQTTSPPSSTHEQPPQNYKTSGPAEFAPNADLRNQHVSKASRNTIIGVAIPGFLVILLATILCIRRAGCSGKPPFDDQKPPKFSVCEGDLEETDAAKTDEPPNPRSDETVEAAPEVDQKNVEMTKLAFLRQESADFSLEELLRATAEMLGKGSFGSTYKAMVARGPPVAVKRFRGDSTVGRKEFDQHMQSLGKLNHPHLMPIKAYSYAKDQHLLVSDYMPRGNLFTLLHGDRLPDRTPFTWPERLKVALLVGRGLSYLHQECGPQKIPHGNLKSTNVLLDENREPRICDFGLVPIVHPSVAAQRMAGFKDPEYLRTKKINHQADVFSFGVLILELMTGKVPIHSVAKGESGVDLPKWVSSVVREEWTAEVFDVELGINAASANRSNEEMMNLLQIGMFCVASSPEERPKLMNAVQMIEEIQEIQSTIERSNSPTATPQDPSTSNATASNQEDHHQS